MQWLRNSVLRLALVSAIYTVALVAYAPALSSAETKVTEADLRAAIVYRILQASSWSGFEQENVKVCETGNGSNSAALHLLDKLKLANQQQLQLLHSEKNLSKCDIVILGPKREKALDDKSGDRFVICNDCEKNTDISAVDLYLHDDKIRYDINLSVAEKLGIHFSSDALKYALTLRRE